MRCGLLLGILGCIGDDALPPVTVPTGSAPSAETATPSPTGTTGAPGATADTAPTGETGVSMTVTAPSCANLNATCGAGDDCCASDLIPGGTFTLGRGPGDPDDCTCGSGCDLAACGGTCGTLACDANEAPGTTATISSFRLDRYEVTVGRFRAFVDAGAPVPTPGSGLHAHLPGGQLTDETGWDATWPLPASWDGLDCSTVRSTWTALDDALPINCVNWYEAYAFCIWDGGFLPTEAEFELATSGGEERVFPWSVPPSDDTIDATLATHACLANNGACTLAAIDQVGSTPLGAGRWGHHDLAGGMNEWLLDWGAFAYPAAGCTDCVSTTGANRMLRGGSWSSTPRDVRSAERFASNPASRGSQWGFRCARTP